MFRGLGKSFVANKKRLSVIAAVAGVFFIGALFVERLLNPPIEEKQIEQQLGSTEVPRTPIADTEQGRMIARILEDEDFQKQLPEKPEKRDQSQNKSEPWPQWAIDLTKIVLMVLGILTIVVFIWILVVGSEGGAQAQKPKKNFKRPTKKQLPVEHHMLVPKATLADVERLAEAGSFGEAVRLLLSVMLTVLAGRELIKIRPSMTGREIVATATFDTSFVRGLRYMVLTVEAYAFAGEQVNRILFDECFEHFNKLSAMKGPSAPTKRQPK